MTDIPNMKLMALVPFPARVNGGIGIDITKENGAYTIDTDWSEFATQTSLPTSPTNNVLTYDTSTDGYVMIPSSLLGGAAAGISDAPINGTQYGRQSGAWTPTAAAATATPLAESGAGAIGVATKYAREDHVHPAAPYDPSNFTKNVGDNNVIGGLSAGSALTTGKQMVVIGAEAGKSATGDTGHVFVGYRAGMSFNSNSSSWNTFVGHSCGQSELTGQGNVAIGRAAMAADTSSNYTLAIGHAAYFEAQNGYRVIAIGDVAAGMPLAGGPLWEGTGLTYYGSNNDTRCSFIGSNTGKSSTGGRTNAHAIGDLARLPLRENVMVLGHNLGAVTTAGRVYDGWHRVNLSSTVGTTITALDLLAGLISRSGSTSGPVTDTTASADLIVTNGPGHNAELPCSVEMSYYNGTSFSVTIAGGAGVAVSTLGLGIIVASGAVATFRICFNVVTSGGEDIIMYRIG